MRAQATDGSATSPRTVDDERQPSALYLLFASEAWERFSYYGMRAIFVLYMIKALGFSESRASFIYGLYGSAVYFTPLVGGYLADRALGYERSILLGGLVMAAGQFCIGSGSTALLYAGLLLLVTGNGLFKPSIATIVGTLYGPGDPRRDRGFTIFYMGVNLGAFFSPIVCGQLLGEKPILGLPPFLWGYRAAGIGMIVGALTFLVGRRGLHAQGPARAGVSAQAPVLGPDAPSADPPLGAVERGRVLALAIIATFVVFFWMAFEQTGSTMTLFTDASTDRHVLGFEVSASAFQSVNPVFILLLAPVLSGVWKALSRTGREPSSPMKMALGVALLGAGFVPLVVAASIAGDHGKASWAWIVATYFFHTVGELCLSPIGLSLVTKLAPRRYAALLMGFWYLSIAVANFLVGVTGTLYSGMGHVQFFSFFFFTSMGAAAALFFLRGTILRLMAGVR